MSRGFQYYLAGRHAALLSFAPVAGNLLHHGFEMLFKAQLRQTIAPSALDRTFHHSLAKLWPEYKSQTGDAKLAKFDLAVGALDRWEEIRYPDNPRSPRGAMQMLIRHPSPMPGMRGGGLYHFSLLSVDGLFSAVLKASGFTQWFIFDLHRQENRELYFAHNRHPVIRQDDKQLVEYDAAWREIDSQLRPPDGANT